MNIMNEDNIHIVQSNIQHYPTMTKKWTSLLLLTPNTSAFVARLAPLHCSQQHRHRRQHQHPLPFSTMTTTTTTSSVECNTSSSSCTSRVGGGSSDDDVIPTTTTNTKRTNKSKRLYSFQEARRIARGHGFDSYEEFMEYTCPGAYQIPKDANIVWKEVSKYRDSLSSCTEFIASTCRLFNYLVLNFTPKGMERLG